MTRKSTAFGISRESLVVRDAIPKKKKKTYDPFAGVRESLKDIDPVFLDALIDTACKKARRETIAKLKKRP